MDDAIRLIWKGMAGRFFLYFKTALIIERIYQHGRANPGKI